MVRVSPTFVSPPLEVTDHTITLVWRIDGDTPFKCIAAVPGTLTPMEDVWLPQTFYKWSGLAPGRLHTLSVACYYPDGDTRWESFRWRTTGVPSPVVTPPRPVTNFRATVNTIHTDGRPLVRLEWDRIDQQSDGLGLQRARASGGVGFAVPFNVTGAQARAMTSFEDRGGLDWATRYQYGIQTYKGSPTDATISDYTNLELVTAAPMPMPVLPGPLGWQEPTEFTYANVFIGLGATAGGQNRIELCYSPLDTRHLVHRAWDGNGWRATDLGPKQGGISVPTVTTWGSDRIDVFYAGASQQLIQRLRAEWAGGWIGEVDLGGRLTSAPAAVSSGANRLDVFYRGTNNQLIQRSERPGVGWTGELDLGSQLAGGPTAASWATNRLDVFYRSPSNRLIQRYSTGTEWSGEVDLGPMSIAEQAAVSDPAAVSWGPNRIDVFYHGPGKRLFQRYWDGARWSAEVDLSGQLIGRPVAVSRAGGTLDVFYPGKTSGFLSQRRYVS